MITLLDGNGDGGEEEGFGMKREHKFVAVDWMKFAIFLIGWCSPWRWRPLRPVAGAIFVGGFEISCLVRGFENGTPTLRAF